MSAKSENSYILYQFFKAKVDMEKELDQIRSQLCQNQNFNAFSLFRRLDLHNRSRIGIQDLLNFLIQQSLNATLQQIQGVLHYFTKDIFIALPTFVNTLLPKNLSEVNNSMSTVEQTLIRFILTIIDHNDELKKISKLTEQMDEDTFDFNFGVLHQFTPQDLIRLYGQFQDKPDGYSFQIIFGSNQSLKWQNLKQNLNWKPAFKKRQPRLSQTLYERKKSFQRKPTLNSSVLLLDISTDQQSPCQTSNKIKFCTDLDLDIFQRQTYLYN